MEATVQTQELSTTNIPAHWPVALLNGEGKKLDASGHTVTLRATGTDTGDAFSIVEVLVPPGNTPPASHRHSFSEAFHIIEGVLTVQLSDHVFLAPAGSFIFVPGGTVHGWRNDEDLPARFLIVSSPAVIDRYYIELDDLYSRLGKTPDTESDEIRGLWKNTVWSRLVTRLSISFNPWRRRNNGRRSNGRFFYEAMVLRRAEAGRIGRPDQSDQSALII